MRSVLPRRRRDEDGNDQEQHGRKDEDQDGPRPATPRPRPLTLDQGHHGNQCGQHEAAARPRGDPGSPSADHRGASIRDPDRFPRGNAACGCEEDEWPPDGPGPPASAALGMPGHQATGLPGPS